MGYAAVKGGLEAIRAAEDLVLRKRIEGDSQPLETDQIRDRLRLAVDRVQGEGGLWAPDLAARAIRQTEGDLIEAALLLRSYRSTLPRFAYTQPADVRQMEVIRRIVPAFREPPGEQLLGRTLDYTQRLIDFGNGALPTDGNPDAAAADSPSSMTGPLTGRLTDLLRDRGLLATRSADLDAEPQDVTREPLSVPARRSARLATLARGETGALVNLWYQGILGDRKGAEDVTLGEVRTGRLPVTVTHPRTGGAVTLGQVEVTEIEAMTNLDRPGEDTSVFDVGYGLVLGSNERKAIAMAILDIAIQRDGGRTGLEQNVLKTCDGVDASGFLEHLKLPHYVTFASQLDRKEALRR